MLTKKNPVAFFSYNRPLHTHKALEALSKCSRLDECDFYFFLDGPRSENLQAQVDATKEILKTWTEHFNAQVVERNINFGLSKSIVSGVTELCERYGRVIVLEDDLVVGEDFLHYMIESLRQYEKEEQVLQIGGFTVSSPEDLSTDVFLLPVTTTWGWATWQRAWQSFSWQPEGLDNAKQDPQWCQLFDLNGTCAFSSMLEDRLAGRNDSWGILWWYAVSRQLGLVAYPRKSLVWNGGFDGSGVHCGSGSFAGQNTPANFATMSPMRNLTFPSKTAYEASHLAQFEDFFRAQHSNQLPKKIIRDVYHKLTTLVQSVKGKVCNAFH